MDPTLLSYERLDRASPDLWPERIPGVSEFVPASPNSNSQPGWLAEMKKDDIRMFEALGSLTSSQLLEKVRDLQNLAYQLGLEEAREMTRGKYLDILVRTEKT